MAPPSTPNKWPSAAMFDDTVAVTVGDTTKKTFTLHRGVVDFYSGYFEAALKGDSFKEGKEGIIELQTESVQTFELFVKWLYTRQLPAAPDTGDNITSLCNLWLFADRRDIPLLANSVIDGMRDEIVRVWYAGNFA